MIGRKSGLEVVCALIFLKAMGWVKYGVLGRNYDAEVATGAYPKEMFIIRSVRVSERRKMWVNGEL